jgi:hypothetical protein
LAFPTLFFSKNYPKIFEISLHSLPLPQRGEGKGEGENVRDKFSDSNA